MPAVLTTLRSKSAAPDVQLGDFGATVGIGQLINAGGKLPDVDKDPTAQCWFEILAGPQVGKLVMCEVRNFCAGPMTFPHKSRCCEFCKEKQIKSKGFRWRHKFQRCSKCRCYYCSSECQKNDWAAHKLGCVYRVHSDERMP